MSPNLNHLLEIISTSLKLKTFRASDNTALSEAIELLTDHVAGSIEDISLVLQVLRQLLIFSPHDRQITNFSEACVRYYERSIDLHPTSAKLHWELGNIYTELKQIDRAVDCYDRALSLKPEFAEAYFSLGNIDLQLGKELEAIDKFERAIQLNPNFAKPYVNLAYLQSKQGKIEESIVNLQIAIQTDPSFAEAYGNLASILIRTQRIDEAVVHLQTALTLKPDYLAARLNLLGIWEWQEKIDRAIELLNQAPIPEIDFADRYANFGGILAKQNRTLEAIDCFERALVCQPNHVYAMRMKLLVLPILYDTSEISSWRQRFTDGLDQFVERVSQMLEVDRAWALESIQSETNFYLVYQGQNDLDLQVKYGQLVHRVMAANYPQYMIQQSVDRQDLTITNKKIRLGYVSTYFRFHAGTRSTLGALQHRNREEFEVYLYYTDRKTDFMTQEFERESDFFHHIPANLEAICDRIIADQLDILVFPDIGMHPLTTQIAALRLAPIQCVCWGHPVTTGLPTIDYFFSGELMEPEDADLHYAEALVRLPKLGVSYPKPVLPVTRKQRSDFNLNDASIIYLSSQSLFKYLPQHDYIFAQIAQQVSQSKFIFFASQSTDITEQFWQRLEQSFEIVNLDVKDFVVIMSRLDWENYLHLNLLADVFLDSLGFSGGNTALDAIACNLPVVTLPGEFMRDRLAYAMLRVLEVPDSIARDREDYIKIAVRLGRDRQWRQEIIQKMQIHHVDLYDDLSCVRAMEEFYRSFI